MVILYLPHATHVLLPSIYVPFVSRLSLTSTVVFTIIALSEFSLAASLLLLRAWLSTIVSDLPLLGSQSAEQKRLVCFELPVCDLGVDVMPNIDSSTVRAWPNRILFDSLASRVKRDETESLPVQSERRKMMSVV